jgi:ABC-type multidrug transport system ATPase subunit
MQSVIRVSGLSKTFGSFKAVDGLSFSVEEGEVYGFLGQNGAGKSTTIRMLLSLIHPTAGLIELFGKPLSSHRKEILQNVGAIIERPDLYPFLSGVENLSLFAVMSGQKSTKAQLIRQLEQVGLGKRYDSKVGTYSQGMKQRLGLAIALIHNPDLIILDEPTNGLDPQGIADMRNLILWMQHELKKTIFVSSHLLHEVEQIANRMLIIDRGKKVTEGSVKELFAPEENVVMIETDLPEEAAIAVQHSAFPFKDLQRLSHGIRLKLHAKKVADLNQFLVEKNIPISGIRSMHSLEDYFIQMTSSNQHVETYSS